MGNSIMYALQNTFAELWGQIISHVPGIFAAIIVLIIGAIVASAFKRLVETVVRKTGVNAAVRNAGAEEWLKKADLNLEVGTILGVLVKWFVLIVFFMVALEMIGLNQVNAFLRVDVLSYVPRVIVAVLILIVSTIIANVVRKAVTSFAKVSNLANAEIFGKVSYAAIITIAILAALNELKIATELIQPLFYGVVFAISLAIGLAFGFGGREAASRAIDSVTKN